MLKMRHKKGGVVTNVVMGVGGLVIGVIVILIITSTLLNADLLEKTPVTVIDEASVWLNETNYTVTDATVAGFSGFAITSAINATDNTTILLANFTQFASSGIFNNASSTMEWDDIYINYTYTRDSDEGKSVNNLESNFTEGIGNISSKIPTILLIVAVVFLFGALLLLVRNAKIMGVGGSGGGSL